MRKISTVLVVTLTVITTVSTRGIPEGSVLNAKKFPNQIYGEKHSKERQGLPMKPSNFTVNKSASSSLMITGVIDGPLPGGLPKAVELYTINHIPNLGNYGLGSANNGGGSDGEEFSFPPDKLPAGQFLYIATESSGFYSFLGFRPTYIHSQATLFNGNDAIELFKDGLVVDQFGDIAQDGTGARWEYTDGWAYRVNGSHPKLEFDPSQWIFSGPNALDSEERNAEAASPWPIASFSS